MPIKPSAYQSMTDKIGYPTYHVNFPKEDGSDKTYRIREMNYNSKVFSFFDRIISASNNKPKINMNRNDLFQLIEVMFPPHIHLKGRRGCTYTTDWNKILRTAVEEYTKDNSDGGKTITTHEIYQLYERVSSALPDYDK